MPDFILRFFRRLGPGGRHYDSIVTPLTKIKARLKKREVFLDQEDEYIEKRIASLRAEQALNSLEAASVDMTLDRLGDLLGTK